VIHRDLKPANILVKADGSPKLLELGMHLTQVTPAGCDLLGSNWEGLAMRA